MSAYANYGIARETGLTGLRMVADSIVQLANAVSRLAKAVEANKPPKDS